MAGVAGFGAVDEIPDTIVLIDGLCLLVLGSGVAIDAGKVGIVGRHLVAIVTWRRIRLVVRNREIIAVIENGIQPVRGAVACVAGSGIAGGDVVRYRASESLRAVPLRDVATVASGICRSQ